MEGTVRITFERAAELYPDEWVIFTDVRTDEETTTFVDGVVFHHGRDQETAYSKARELHGGGAIFYTGDPHYRKVTLQLDEDHKAAA